MKVAITLLLLGSAWALEAKPKLYTDDHGVYYKEYIWSKNYSGPVRRYIKEFVNFDTPEKIVGVGSTATKPQNPRSDQPVRTEVDRQKAIAKAEADGMAVDRSIGLEGYRFGQAGASAAISAFAYGVVSNVVADAARAGRIEKLRTEVSQLDDALKRQAGTAQDANLAFASALAERGAAIETALRAVADLPKIGVFDSAFNVNGTLLFATPDAYFALRLARMVDGIQATADRVPPEVRDTGMAAVRLADLASARDDTNEAESFIAIARTVADVAVGLDPVTAPIRGVYELVTGRNLITGGELTPLERGLACINVATLGGFATIQEASKGLGQLGRILGGTKLKSIETALGILNRFSPVKLIDRLLSSRIAGKAVLEEGTLLLDKSKPILASFPADAQYARVLKRSLAEKLTSSGKLAESSTEVFVTAAEDLRGLDSGNAIAKRLTLYEPGTTKLKSLDGYVIAEFKFTPANDPLLSSPIGKAGSWGTGWVPGGRTLGQAREWIVNSKAVEEGLIDVGSIKIREIPKP